MPAIALPPSVPSAAAGPSSHANGAPNGDAKGKGPKSKNAKRRAKRKDERAAVSRVSERGQACDAP